MINTNDLDYEAIQKVQDQMTAHEFLVNPDDIRAVLKRFELLLEDYANSANVDTDEQRRCSHCHEKLHCTVCGEDQ